LRREKRNVGGGEGDEDWNGRGREGRKEYK
jgi:hypothetical protein